MCVPWRHAFLAVFVVYFAIDAARKKRDVRKQQ